MDTRKDNQVLYENHNETQSEVQDMVLIENWIEVWQLKAQLYSFLGNSLLKPLSDDVSSEVLNPRFWRNFPLFPANRQMDEALGTLIVCTEKLMQLNRAEAQTAVNVEFTRLFIGPGKPSAPPWESLYCEGAVTLFGRPTEEMRELYRKRDLRLERPGKQFEDHLGLELLFLARCSEDSLTGTTDVTHIDLLREEAIEQLAFIRDHPLWWIERLLDNATAAMSVGYYPALIKLTWGILLWDETLLVEYLQRPELDLNSSGC